MIESIRRFNRYYARMLGIFSNKYLEVNYSPTEVRVIGEIGRRPGITAQEISAYLALDKSYLSRIIRKLSNDGLVQRRQDSSDGRNFPLYLTESGTKLNAQLDLRANQRIEDQIGHLSLEDRRELVAAMERIRQILADPAED